jgi:hypothetical protein
LAVRGTYSSIYGLPTYGVTKFHTLIQQHGQQIDIFFNNTATYYIDTFFSLMIRLEMWNKPFFINYFEFFTKQLHYFNILMLKLPLNNVLNHVLLALIFDFFGILSKIHSARIFSSCVRIVTKLWPFN